MLKMINANKVETGKRIRELRREKGYKSIEKFADELGYSRQTVAKWENGETMPTLDTLYDIVSVLDCDMGYLLCLYDTRYFEHAEICEETGLSAEAVEILMEEKKRLNKIDEWNEKKNGYAEHKSRSLMLEVIERIIKNDKYIQTEIEELKTTRRNIKSLEEEEDFKDIEKAFNEALKERISWEYADGGSFEDAERKSIFLDKLREIAIRYYDSNEYNEKQREFLDELITMARDGRLALGENSPDRIIQPTEMTEEEIKSFFKVPIDTQAQADEYVNIHFQAYDVLSRRAELEKEELAIGLKFQKIVNDVIESFIS